jgi:lipopolysaccharide/colanic/teichoic acid biosynthesis glycosyltransferase
LSIANKGAGAFFLQERPGKDEKIFKVIKFKTWNTCRYTMRCSAAAMKRARE